MKITLQLDIPDVLAEDFLTSPVTQEYVWVQDLRPILMAHIKLASWMHPFGAEAAAGPPPAQPEPD